MMHATALRYGKLFFETYVPNDPSLTIMDLGSQDVNGSLRSVAPEKCKYVGVDFQQAKGVDVVISDPYELPFESDSVDVCVSSSCFEHSEFFWLVFLEVVRVLKPGGLFYLNTPSNGNFHRYPVDCWRFYPDSGAALQNWARRNGHEVSLTESFIGRQHGDIWNDFVAVFAKTNDLATVSKKRMLSQLDAYTNGRLGGSEEYRNFSVKQEDQRGIKARLRAKLGMAQR